MRTTINNVNSENRSMARACCRLCSRWAGEWESSGNRVSVDFSVAYEDDLRLVGHVRGNRMTVSLVVWDEVADEAVFVR